VFSVNAYGIISSSVPVPYRQDDLRNTKYTPPSPVRLKPTCRGGVLVGLILVSNDDQQSSNHYPDYLARPIIRTIKCPTGGDYANLTCYEISKLNTSAWLDDAIIHGAVYMMEAHLLSTHNDNKEPNQQLVRSSILFENKIKNCNASVGFNTTFPNSSFGVFIINLSQIHWICACVSRKMQRIYIMDSYNDINMETCDQLNAYFSKYFGWTKFKTVLVGSPYQNDSVSCGLFTIINAIVFLKSIITGDFQKEGPEWGWVSEDITMTDKALIRRQLRDIFYGNINVDVLLQWIQKKG
jgi:Ulp1 family protease